MVGFINPGWLGSAGGQNPTKKNWEESRIKLISAKAEAEALLGLAEFSNTIPLINQFKPC